MSEITDNKVLVVSVDRIEAHPNADRLEIAHVSGWNVIVRKGALQPGQLAVYFPIDSVLPQDLEDDLFPPDSKIKLSKSRIKTIKLRGAISQGMLVPDYDAVIAVRAGVVTLGQDLTNILGVTHYEPPMTQGVLSAGKAAKKKHPFFPEYTKISHFKNYPHLFEEGEPVIVTEKIHGTNFRAGWVPTASNTWWRKIKKFFKMLPEWEFVFGSHRVNIVHQHRYNGFYPVNVYQEAVEKYALMRRIPKGYILYGEIYGDGIQKGYHYGLPSGERRLAIFDVLVTKHDLSQEYLSWDGVVYMSEHTNIPTVPLLYRGEYKEALRVLWEQGPSLIGWTPDHEIVNNEPAQPHREGCVIKPRTEQQCWIGRKMLRSINPEYLLIAESDWH